MPKKPDLTRDDAAAKRLNDISAGFLMAHFEAKYQTLIVENQYKFHFFLCKSDKLTKQWKQKTAKKHVFGVFTIIL